MKLDIVSRPVLPDRIQVSVIPDLMSIYDYIDKKLILKEKYKNYTEILIKNCKLKKYENNRFRNKKNILKYIINIPCDLNYVSNVRLNAFDPFSFSFKFNFIRYLRSKIINEIDHNYDVNILLDEDNYISNKVWKTWNYNLVYDIIYNLNDIILEIVDKAMFDFLPVNDLKYTRVTINQIETNIDFDVGVQKSLYFMNLFSDFINTDKGIEFRSKIGEISLKHRIPYNLSNEPTNVNKNESISVQFQICKGLFCKIYRKNKDNIRFELLFEKNYLKRKFRKIEYESISTSTNIKRILRPVMEFSKDFFKDIGFEKYLSSLVNMDKYNLVFNQLDPVYNHFRQTQPEINDIIDCLSNNMPITNNTTIKYISNHPEHSKRFRRELNENGRKILIPDYSNLDRPKMKRLLPYKTNKSPKVPKPVLVFAKPVPKKVVWYKNKMYVEEWDFKNELC